MPTDPPGVQPEFAPQPVDQDFWTKELLPDPDTPDTPTQVLERNINVNILQIILSHAPQVQPRPVLESPGPDRAAGGPKRETVR